jgi:2'-5' RNA ligase
MAAQQGIFVLVELTGPVRDTVHRIQQQYDPKLAKSSPPHITLVGSSGVGPIPTDTTPDTIRSVLEPIAASTAPMTLTFGTPKRFMQTEIISLPLDPHGPLRTLHERIATSSLPFVASRFQFSPHCTLNFYRTLTRETERELLALRVTEPVEVRALQVYMSREGKGSRLMFTVPLGGAVLSHHRPPQHVHS